MAVFTWPSSGRGFHAEEYVEEPEWDVEITFARNGRITTRSLPGMRWVATMKFADESMSELVSRRQLEAFLMKLRGGANRLAVWHLLTPAPLGTMRGTPVLASTAAAGAFSCTVTGEDGTTLLRGDRIGLGGQRVMVTADAAIDGVVEFEPALRNAVSGGTAVIWDKPTTTYVLRNPKLALPVRADKLPGFAIELVEE
jgi:hypothetical protein